MISGALFLSRDISARKMYSKYILRIVLAFVFWSFIYAVITGDGIEGKIGALVKGHYHL